MQMTRHHLMTRTVCVASPTGTHSHLMATVLPHGSQQRFRCDFCGVPVRVYRARWVADFYLIEEQW